MTDQRRTVAVVGGSGFVGRAVVTALTAAGHDVRVVSAPRLTLTPADISEAVSMAIDCPAIPALTDALRGSDIVVNAAGVADAGRGDTDVLFGANAVLPRTVREAAVGAGAARFIHVSSAGVQGRHEPLDETSLHAPFSPYTTSKAWGESVLAGCPETILFRPTSVHGPGRGVTASLVRLARSPAASVAGQGNQPTPQVLASNVGAAIAFTATSEERPPGIVLQPTEGLTTSSLLEALGARRIRHVPRPIARTIVVALTLIGRLTPSASANARRVQMLWFGQAQSVGWLSEVGWQPPFDSSEWYRLSSPGE